MRNISIIESISNKYKMNPDSYVTYGKGSPADEWRKSVPLIQKPKVLQEYLKALDLKGAVIKNVFYASESSETSRDAIDAISKDTEYELDYLITNDVLIILTDKGAIEIEFSSAGSIFIGMDMLPDKGYSKENSCLPHIHGKKIVGYIIEKFDKEQFQPNCFCNSNHGVIFPKHQPSYIGRIAFVLDNGLRLNFEAAEILDFVNGLHIKNTGFIQVTVPPEKVCRYCMYCSQRINSEMTEEYKDMFLMENEIK